MGDRPEDAPEDASDRAIRQSRVYAEAAVQLMAAFMLDKEIEPRDRIEAARVLLEVAGCL